MRHGIAATIVMAFLVGPLLAQNTTLKVVDEIEKAKVQVQLAEEAGAPNHAPTLLEEAKLRLEKARSELEANRESAASRAAAESSAAADAAQAKSKWLSTIEEIRALRANLTEMGAELKPMELGSEEPVVLGNAETSRERVAQAREVVSKAREMRPTGAEGAELDRAETLLQSAEKIVGKTKQNAVADHLAYTAAMTARKAIYVTRLRELAGVLPELRLKRTEMAQAEAARQAEEARREREEAERELESMRQKLEEERNRRAAEQEQIQRLREDLEKQQAALAKELASARAARIEAEQRLDYLRAQYENALRSSASDASEIEQLRQKVEDQEIKLDQIRKSEEQSERTLLREIDALRADLKAEREKGRIPQEELQRQEQELAEREAEIEQLREQRNQSLEQRREAEMQFRERIARAEEQMRVMAEQSAELEKRLEEERKAREEAERELARMRAEIEQREKMERERAEEMEAMKKQLAELAETRSDDRGFIVTLPGLFFDSGKATLKEGTKSNLTKIAELLEKMKKVRIIVEGHTDSVGSAELNQKLSESRADAVRDYLVAEGVEAVAITTVGRGESQPIASNDTQEGRSKNRRVEIVIEELE